MSATAKAEDKKRILLGRVGVDSGTLLVIDPSYVNGPVEFDPYRGERLPPDLSVIFQSGLGDGLYDVYGEEAEIVIGGSSWGRRLLKVEIELIPDAFFDGENAHAQFLGVERKGEPR